MAPAPADKATLEIHSHLAKDPLRVSNINFCKRNNCLSFLFVAIEPVVAEDPCDPNPCGPNSLPPQQIGDRCHCTCMPEMIGSPPNCRPECVVNSDCSQELACISRKCQDPCPGLCGINAYCRVRSHVPICVCNQGYQGDPFSRCNRITSKHWQCGTKHVSNIFSISHYSAARGH